MTTATQMKYEVLRHQAEALRIIFESLPVAVMVADNEGKIIFSNPAVENILNTSGLPLYESDSASVLGWYLPDQQTLIAPEQLPLARAVRGERVVDELIFVRRQFDIRASHGDAGAWIRVDGWPLRDDAERVCGGVIMFHDFTEGLAALQMLRLLSRVVEQTADNVLLTDRNGVIQYVNPAFEKTTGYRSEEVVGQTPRVLKSGMHDAGFYRQLWERLMEGQPCQGMIINRKKSGDLYWAQQAITPIRDEAGHLTHFVSVVQDITELRKKQEQEFQLQLARDVQRQFYAAATAIPGFDIGAAAYPAYETGGDYFDFVPSPDGSLIIAVGDVQGHGFGSALLMALTRAYLRSFVAMGLDLDEILARVNAMLFKDLEHGRFVTLSLSRLDPLRQTLSYASAGHVTGHLLEEFGNATMPLESTGPPLGLFEHSKFHWVREIPLRSGHVAVLMTDGASESAASDGTEFGTRRVLDYLQTHRDASAQQMVDGIYTAARTFVNFEPQNDDITLVVIKVTGSAN